MFYPQEGALDLIAQERVTDHLRTTPVRTGACAKLWNRGQSRWLVEHHGAKVLLDLAMTLAIGGEVVCDTDLLRSEEAMPGAGVLLKILEQD
ncbi:MAG: hypothetical protein L0G94_08845 [Brachybacterium sp.]|uniref:hypothetical protein n=1 Tax=Brachybacterium sp. TaxID=1891286 RepID=UPI002648DC1A|nr:hypothetical protein [Brachybacterium sp.]MDN5686773.1 hypothetical protein [Brachybacterium sp.]